MPAPIVPRPITPIRVNSRCAAAVLVMGRIIPRRDGRAGPARRVWKGSPSAPVDSRVVRLVVARCQVDYAGRLTAHLPMATRVLMIKADGSVLVHSDGGSYKPLNWMSPPCKVREGVNDEGQVEWVVTGKDDDTLRILIEDVQHDSSHELGVDPGLQKDGVEKHLQELLAEHPATLADGLTLVRREYPTAIGPVDLMCRDAAGASRRGRDQAPRRDRRRRAADPLPRAAQPRPAAGPGPRHLRRPGDQAPGAGAGHRPRHRLRRRRLRRPARARRPEPPALLSMPIFHIATAADWAAAQRSGTYTTSTRGRTLEQEGFIHASGATRAWASGRRSTRTSVEPLVLLSIDTDLLTSSCAGPRSRRRAPSCRYGTDDVQR